MPDRSMTYQDLVKIGITEPSRGLTFFVDTELGASGNSGLTPNDAINTITQALTKCVTQRGDTIIVQRWETDNSETWPLPMSVEGVTLRGVVRGVLTPYQQSLAQIVCPDNVAVIALTAHRCRIMNLYLSCPASYDAITFAVNGWTGIIGNHFATCNDAIGGGVGASTSIGWQSEISYNFFSAAVGDHGIYQNNPANLLIKGNIFSKVQGVYALYLESASRPQILDNKFALHSDVIGSAIRLRSAVLHGLIDNNRASFSRTGMVNNPFVDECPVTANGNIWLLNYTGLTATMPDATI